MAFQRTVSPQHANDGASVKLYDKIYIGFVTSSTDAKNAGRLTVWIPDISSNQENTFVVQFCSFFAGATPITQVPDGSKTQAQQSYGWWGVPPDIGNMVVVAFINGDPNRGIWFGCLYQEYMNNMVPNIPASSTTDTPTTIEPTYEYNKRDVDQIDTDSPLRPPFTPLVTALANQGLSGDQIRGPAQNIQDSSTESSAISSKENISGFLSPGASQIVFDDTDTNKHIRFRTENGTQILINDTIGLIYFISRNGNSWAEISDDGINFYSNGDISFRSQANINFHADSNINLNSVNAINANSYGSITLQSVTNTNVLTGTSFTLNSGGDIGLLSDSNFNLKSNINSITGNSFALKANNIGINSSGNLYLTGSQIQQNNGSGPSPNTPASATGLAGSTHADIDNSVVAGYPSITTKSIVSTLPSHEPWSAHQTAVVTPKATAVNTEVSTPDEVETTASSTSNSSSSSISTNNSDSNTTQESTENNTSSSSNSSDWWLPVTGIVNSLFGNRGSISGLNVGSFHPGIDIHRNNGYPIYASRGGKVVYAAQDQKPYTGYGKCVVINHGDGYTSIYGHMSQMSVSYGDTVEQNQQIGNVGKTGMATGPHLHFEIRNNGVKTNPATLLPILGVLGNKITAGNPATV